MFVYNTNKRSYFLGVLNMQMQIGQTVEIVYLDKVGKISQRKIEINGIRNGPGHLQEYRSAPCIPYVQYPRLAGYIRKKLCLATRPVSC